jgi:glutamyl-tRNA synthetase
MPVLIHLPLLRNPDQSKLSKRKNPTSVTYYRDEGFLPEALLNYLGLMGYSMPDEREVFSKQDMLEVFDESRISVGAPIFDPVKLSWLNGQYLRTLDEQEYADRVASWMLNKERLSALVPLVQERAEKLSDLIPLVDYLVGARKELSDEDFQHKTLERKEVVQVIHHTLAAFDEMRSWERDDLFQLCQDMAQNLEMKFRDFLFPLFIAISGRSVSLPLFDSLVFLGADLSRARLRDALEMLNVSGKERKKLDKSFAALPRDLNLT